MRADLRALYREHAATLKTGFVRALEAEGHDAIVIHSGKALSKSDYDDQSFALNPVPLFSYWAPVRWPDCAIVVSEKGARLIVLREASYWERPSEPDWDFIREGLEVVEVTSEHDLERAIAATSKTAVIGSAPSQVKPSLLERLHDLRVFKTPYEIECMAQASRIGARGHKAAADAFHAGERSELAIHLRYLAATEQDDAETPYKNIVALGDAAAILHHITYRKVPEAKSFLLDAGASFHNYPSDITRTYASDRGLFAELIQRMELLQQRVISKVAVGMPYENLHDDSHRELADVLVDLAIVKGSSEACVESGVTRKLFPHGLGHSLGIQVHDVGCRKTQPKPENPYLRNTRTIEAGQVFTIEPGCYFIDTLLAELKASPAASSVDWSKIDALRPYGGIRIEDNVVVLPPGGRANVRNLTREAFATS
jgi:Xaa-Pro dipeptidase